MILALTKNDLLESALHYAELGYPVFPCVPGDKRPATKHGLRDATTNPAVIRQWWAENPKCNIGIRCDGLLVLDLDIKPEFPVNHFLDDKPSIDYEVCPTVKTPRGGRHFFFRQNGTPLKNSTSKLAENVDTRADGGYVVVPPSIVHGKRYEWVAALTPRDELPIVPKWVVTSKHETYLSPNCTEPITNEIEERAQRYLAKIPPAISGQGGHNQTFTVACSLVLGFGLSSDRAFPLLAEWNQTCQPPWSEKELWHKLDDANKKGGPRGWLIEEKPYTGTDAELRDLFRSTSQAKTKTYGISAKNKVMVSVLTFDPKLLPDSIRAWVVDIAERTQCPLDFPAIGAMVVLAAIVGRQVGIRPKKKMIGQ